MSHMPYQFESYISNAPYRQGSAWTFGLENSALSLRNFDIADGDGKGETSHEALHAITHVIDTNNE